MVCGDESSRRCNNGKNQDLFYFFDYKIQLCKLVKIKYFFFVERFKYHGQWKSTITYKHFKSN